MKTNYQQIYAKNCLPRSGRIIVCASIVNFILAISMIRHVRSAYATPSININPGSSMKVEYDYYFRIEYRIVQGVCQPLYMFNTTETINSLQKMTNQRINEIISENLTINLQILKTTAILENFEKINENTYFIKWRKLVCNYILELFVRIDFPFYCDNKCQSVELYHLTLNKNPFGNLSDLSLKFVMTDTNSIEYYIENVVLYQTVKYLEQIVFIQSIVTKCSISIKIVDSNICQTFVSMSTTDQTLFILKKGLDFLDTSSIYVSFVSLIQPDLYLRHENGRIIIAKSDQSILFRQDATFKLIVDHEKDLVAFQAINVPDYFCLGLDNKNYSNLILNRCENTIINKLDRRFVFKIIAAT